MSEYVSRGMEVGAGGGEAEIREGAILCAGRTIDARVLAINQKNSHRFLMSYA